jgi:putative peptidoglycan lipid II flippase
MSLFGMSVSAAELPAMSSAIGTSSEGFTLLRERLDIGLRRIAFFIVPSAMALLAFGDVMTAALYQSGEFRKEVSIYVWAILAGSTIGLLATTLGRLYASSYYAMHNTRTPLLFATIRVALTILLGYGFALRIPPVIGLNPKWGAVGLTTSAGIAGWIEFVLPRRTLNKLIGKTGLPLGYLLKLWLAAGTAATLGWVIKLNIGTHHPIIIAIVVLVPYGLVYFASTAVLSVPELQAVVRPIRTLIKRLLVP